MVLYSLALRQWEIIIGLHSSIGMLVRTCVRLCIQAHPRRLNIATSIS